MFVILLSTKGLKTEDNVIKSIYNGVDASEIAAEG